MKVSDSLNDAEAHNLRSDIIKNGQNVTL